MEYLELPILQISTSLIDEIDKVGERINKFGIWQTLIIVLIILLFFVANKIYEYYQKKNNNKPLNKIVETLDANCKHLDKLTSTLTNYIYDSTKGNENKCKTILELSFNSFRGNIFEFARTVVLSNNLKINEILIKENIRQKVSTEYYSVFTSLSLFDIEGINVSSYLNVVWIEEISNDIISILFQNSDAQSRIDSINKRLNLKLTGYENYIYNKIFT